MEDDGVSDEDDRRNRKKGHKGRSNIIKLVIADNEKTVELVKPRMKRKGMIGRPKGSKNKNRRDDDLSDNEKPPYR